MFSASGLAIFSLGCFWIYVQKVIDQLIYFVITSLLGFCVQLGLGLYKLNGVPFEFSQRLCEFFLEICGVH